MLLFPARPGPARLTLEFCAVLITMNATRAATIVRGTPFSWAFEMLWLAHFLTIPVLVAIYSIFLVIIPVWDTSKAAKVCFV